MLKTLFLFRDENGRSALFLAVSGQHAESAQVLLQAGKQLYLTSTKVVHENIVKVSKQNPRIKVPMFYRKALNSFSLTFCFYISKSIKDRRFFLFSIDRQSKNSRGYRIIRIDLGKCKEVTAVIKLYL